MEIGAGQAYPPEVPGILTDKAHLPEQDGPSHQPEVAFPSRPPKTHHTPGSGHLHLSNPTSARFSSLRASYPLKLLAPDRLPSQPANIATAYLLAYGGGLVAGDTVSLEVDVDAGCGVVLLTQGSTKVFKHRPGIRPLSHRIIRDATPYPSRSEVHNGAGVNMKPGGGGEKELVTRQRLLTRLEPSSMCIVMPDSVSPFRSSRYSQVQRFLLPRDRTASLLVLDWVNSGRGHRGPGRTFIDGDDREVWAMGYYGSTNEVLIGDELIMRERLVLDNEDSTASPSSLAPKSADGASVDCDPEQSTKRSTLTKIARQLAPYHVYGTVLILGPAFVSLVEYLKALTDHTSQMQIHTPPSLLWSYSATDPQGGVLRIAAVEVEDAKRWLREVMTYGSVQHVVGEGLWPRII